MSALPKALARRIDRLSIRAHAFHRYAHHPLCAAYAGEVIALGRRTRICKGCAYAAVGTSIGFLVGLFVRLPVFAALSLGAIGSGLAAASLVFRTPKALSRLLAGLLCALSITSAAFATGLSNVLLAAGICALAGIIVVRYRARGPHRVPCSTCPERDHAPCSGFRRIVLRERAFQRVAQRWIDQTSSPGR